MTKKTLINLALFILCNVIGFYISPLTGVLLMQSGDPEQLDLLRMQNDIGMIALTWAVCGVFSFASFFLHGRWKMFFLLCPVIMPLITAIITMRGH